MSVVGPDGTLHAPGSLRALEHKSIRDFVQSAADEGYLSGRVLDYGCGKQPYRDIVEAAGGDYRGFDKPTFPASTAIGVYIPDWPHVFDAILCTQVIQYVPDPDHLIGNTLANQLRPINLPGENRQRGHLVMTYPTNWPEVEPEDLHRFTKAGMERLLIEAGFEIVRHERRGIGAVSLSGDEFALGYGVIARA